MGTAVVGIDFGTTNSSVAVYENGAAVVIPNASGNTLTPSAVSLGEDGAYLVGEAARFRSHTHPDRTVTRIKRDLGRAIRRKLGKKEIRAEELAAIVLRQLWDDATTHLGAPPQEAVLTVPAYFTAAQRQGLKDACSIAGLPVERLINEPTAAALAYGLHLDAERRTIVVCDLGGGTFDVTVLVQEEGVMEIRASSGDSHLGGEDMLDRLVSQLQTQYQQAHGRACPERSVEDGLFRLCAERAKCALSDTDATTFRFPGKGSRFPAWETPLQREALERWIEPVLVRVEAPLLRALRDAHIGSHPDALVLVGGPTRMPAVRRLLASLVGCAPESGVDPDHAVVQGAAIQAALKAGNQAIQDLIVSDVTPFTLSVEVSRERDGSHFSGFMLPILHRNTPIPVSRSERVLPIHPDQTSITLAVYQGEGRLAADNESLGKLEVRGIPREGQGARGVDVRFTYDRNGLLEVESTLESTGERQTLMIRKHAAALTAQQVASAREAMAAIKVHPRDERVNRELMEKARSLYAALPLVLQEQLGPPLDGFVVALERQDARSIPEARSELQQAMARITGQSRDETWN